LAWAFWTVSLSAQTAISAAGLVESTSGGFKFPDGTVQSGAAASDGTPVHLFGKCLVANNANTGVGLIFTVPAGKRLEVDFVSLAAVNLDFGEGLLPLIHMGAGNSSFYFEEMVGGNHYPGLGPSLIRTASKIVHMDAAAGDNVSCEVWTTLNSGTNRELQVSIAGHLLDAAP
jgi:hypothetical protein